jgi:hypothetical protein
MGVSDVPGILPGIHASVIPVRGVGLRRENCTACSAVRTSAVRFVTANSYSASVVIRNLACWIALTRLRRKMAWL